LPILDPAEHSGVSGLPPLQTTLLDLMFLMVGMSLCFAA
jgi:hypothetical protein